MKPEHEKYSGELLQALFEAMDEFWDGEESAGDPMREVARLAAQTDIEVDAVMNLVFQLLDQSQLTREEWLEMAGQLFDTYSDVVEGPFINTSGGDA